MDINRVEILKLAKKESRGHNIIIEILLSIIVTIVGFMLTALINGIIYGFLLESNIITNIDFLSVISSLLGTIGMILVVILYCTFIEKRSLKSMGFTKKRVLKNYGTGLLVGFILFSIAFFISVITGGTKIIGISENINIPILILMFIGFMIQGMSEEVLCRGYIMISIGRRYGLLVGSILNSVLFSALHLGNSGINTISLINITLVGLVFSFYMIKKGNIWGVGAMHTMWNFAQGNIYGGSVSGMNLGITIIKTKQIGSPSIINGGIFGIEGTIGTTIVLLVFLVILLKDIKFVKDEDYIDYHLE